MTKTVKLSQKQKSIFEETQKKKAELNGVLQQINEKEGLIAELVAEQENLKIEEIGSVQFDGENLVFELKEEKKGKKDKKAE